MKAEQIELSQPRLWPGMKGLSITPLPVPERESTLDPKQFAAMQEVSNAMLHGIETDTLGNSLNSRSVEIVLIGPSQPEPQA